MASLMVVKRWNVISSNKRETIFSVTVVVGQVAKVGLAGVDSPLLVLPFSGILQ